MATTAQAPPESDDPGPSGVGLLSSVRARAIVIGFLMAVPVSYGVVNGDTSSMFSMMVPPISGLLIIVLLNNLWRWVFGRAPLNQTDLIAIFAVLSVAGAAAGELSHVPEPLFYHLPDQAKTNVTVRDHLIKRIPDAFAVKDLKQIQDMYGGGKGLEYANHKFWMFFPKAFPWIILIVSIYFAMQCINSLMRGAWCQRERLSFPLIQLPVAICESGGAGGMWRSRYMWIAFGVMFAIDILNGLNYLYPNLPAIPVKTLFSIDQAFKEPPLSQMGDFRISIYPFMAAIGLFMPSDMLLSFVVFFLLRILTHIVFASNGISQQTFSGSGLAPGPPYFDEQTWGAVLALFLGAVWVSREYLKELWRDIRRFAPSEDGGIRHTWAFLGLIASSAVVMGYGVVFGQFPVWYSILYFVAFLVFSIVLTRVRAQLGPPTHEFAFFGVNALLGRFLGNKWLTDTQATWSSTGYLLMNRIYRNHPMPVQLEAMKIGQIERVRQRQIFWMIAIAMVMGVFLCYYFGILRTYRTGDLGYTDAPAYMDKILNDRHGPDVVGIMMTVFGFAVVMGLDAVRFRFPGFPLHPAGYFLSMNFGVDYYWFGLLIALVVKNFVQRYYGLTGYEKLRAVALGILLGEYAAETIWLGMALITHQSTYTISFNDRSLGIQ